MNERPITLFVPPDIHPPAPAKAIPIPPLQKAPFTSPLLLGVAAVNRSGRLSEQRLVSALGWTPSDRLAIEATQDMIIIRRAANGPFTLDSRNQVLLPHALQTLFSITTSDRVVLVAIPQHDMLIIHTVGAIAGLIATDYDRVLPVITQSGCPCRDSTNTRHAGAGPASIQGLSTGGRNSQTSTATASRPHTETTAGSV